MPPCRTISCDLKAHIPVLHQKGYSVEEICDLLWVKKTLVYNTLSYSRAYGVPYNIHAHRAGRPRILKPPDIHFIKALLDRRQIVYINELQEELYQIRNTRVSVPTLLRTLQRLNFSHKLISHKAAERDDLLRSAFMNRIADQVPNPDMLMFVDEAARDRRTSQ